MVLAHCIAHSLAAMHTAAPHCGVGLLTRAAAGRNGVPATCVCTVGAVCRCSTRHHGPQRNNCRLLVYAPSPNAAVAGVIVRAACG